MDLDKLKRATHHPSDELARRIAIEIEKRASDMTPEERAWADSETKRIANQVERS